MEVMRRDDFVRELAEHNKISKASALAACEMVLEGIERNVRNGKKVSLVRFGTFYVKTHKGHAVHLCPGVNSIDDYEVMKFSPAVSLTRRLRNKEGGGAGNEPKQDEKVAE